MTGRVYIGEVLNQYWLKSVKKRCVMKMKQEKNDTCIKILFMEGSPL